MTWGTTENQKTPGKEQNYERTQEITPQKHLANTQNGTYRTYHDEKHGMAASKARKTKHQNSRKWKNMGK